jgi:putative heme iron utilization protein
MSHRNNMVSMNQSISQEAAIEYLNTQPMDVKHFFSKNEGKEKLSIVEEINKVYTLASGASRKFDLAQSLGSSKSIQMMMKRNKEIFKQKSQEEEDKKTKGYMK